MSLGDSGWSLSMRLDLDSGLFLVFRTSWLLWSQLGSANWSKHCFVIAQKLVTKIPDVFLCERALNSTVVRLCYKGLQRPGWSVTLEFLTLTMNAVLDKSPVKSLALSWLSCQFPSHKDY